MKYIISFRNDFTSKYIIIHTKSSAFSRAFLLPFYSFFAKVKTLTAYKYFMTILVHYSTLISYRNIILMTN